MAILPNLVALLLAHPAPALVCTNLASVENQNFPEKIELVFGKRPERELSVKVVEKGAENAAVAKQNHSYAASRLGGAEEARYHVPSYYVSDNPEKDLFADDERDTATYLFLEPGVLKGRAGKVKLWLHYHGDGYRGVESNRYRCAKGANE